MVNLFTFVSEQSFPLSICHANLYVEKYLWKIKGYCYDLTGFIGGLFEFLSFIFDGKINGQTVLI